MRDYHKKEYKSESDISLLVVLGFCFIIFLSALLDWWFKVPS